MGILDFFFKWYQGAVWSNILASILWSAAVGIPAFFWGRSKARKHINHIHRRLDHQDAKMEAHADKLHAVHEHIKEKL